jgi:predicted membrane channel-forming protein YqfA (hemolysin III family)
MNDKTDLVTFAILAWGVLSWITHIVTCIGQAKYMLLLVGAFVFPVGCIHGTGVWLGFF